ncbi:hypothetical protein BS17DRAFT_768445 [Gyrodon lividus]|nr:hypothetical protein BS17DRAFT_768445 [Gyrodon lividus]
MTGKDMYVDSSGRCDQKSRRASDSRWLRGKEEENSDEKIYHYNIDLMVMIMCAHWQDNIKSVTGNYISFYAEVGALIRVIHSSRADNEAEYYLQYAEAALRSRIQVIDPPFVNENRHAVIRQLENVAKANDKEVVTVVPNLEGNQITDSDRGIVS